MFFIMRSNDSFNFPLGWMKYIVIVISLTWTIKPQLFDKYITPANIWISSFVVVIGSCLLASAATKMCSSWLGIGTCCTLVLDRRQSTVSVIRKRVRLYTREWEYTSESEIIHQRVRIYITEKTDDNRRAVVQDKDSCLYKYGEKKKWCDFVMMMMWGLVSSDVGLTY